MLSAKAMRRSAWLGWGLVACSAPSAASTPATSAVAVSASAVASDAVVASAPVASAPPPAHTGPLERFHDALRELETGRRREHVRILWLGDSHAQADFWTGAIRSSLQKRFGNAGPGFVHLGMAGYRHDGVDVGFEGRWRMRPIKPSTDEITGDGAFGLGGVLLSAASGGRSAFARVTEKELASRTIRWDLCMKSASVGERFELRVGDAREVIVPTHADLGGFRHLQRESRGEHRLVVSVLDASPFFCGAHASTDPAERAGLLLDSLGINGARYSTALAWNEDSWVAEARRLPTDLVVFQYGTNESSDYRVRPDRYRKNALALLARARRAQPEVSCLIVGPPDRAGGAEVIPPINEALRSAAREGGCAFWDALAAMGGSGSFVRWRDDKLASPDGLHLLRKGYVKLGALVVEEMLADYRRN